MAEKTIDVAYESTCQEILKKIEQTSVAISTASNTVLKTLVDEQINVKNTTRALGSGTAALMRGYVRINATMCSTNGSCGYLYIYKNGVKMRSIQATSENEDNPVTYSADIYVSDGDILSFELHGNNSTNYAKIWLLTVCGTVSGNGSFV